MTETGEALEVRTPDGATLSARRFEPEGEVRGLLLIAGAVGAPQRYYRRFAEHAAASGLRTLTFDYRRFGDSEGAGGPSANLTRWGLVDLPSALRALRKDGDELPLYLVGHSLGGQFFGTMEDARDAAGAAIVASMGGQIANLEKRRRTIGLLFRYGVPLIGRLRDPVPSWMGLGVPLPSGAMRQWARWCLHDEYYLSEHPELREALAKFEAPLTFLSFSDDDIAPRVNVEWLVDLYSAAAPLHLHLDPAALDAERMGHFGFFKSGGEPYWASLIEQLRDHRRDYVPSREDGVLDRAAS